jgi:hypothetical protein
VRISEISFDGMAGSLLDMCCPPRFRTAQAASFSRYSFGVR